MSREMRDWLRREIDAARRRQIKAARFRAEPTSGGKRTDYWRNYYHANREHISASRRSRRGLVNGST